MPTAFCQATKSSVPWLYFDSYPSLGHLISRTLPINVIGYTNNFACLICEQGFKNKKEARIIVAGANQKEYVTI